MTKHRFIATYYDIRQAIRVLSWSKIKNFIGLYFAYKKAKKKKPSNLAYMPAAISVEPTTSCNLRCPQCPSGLRSFSRPTGMLAQDTLEKVLQELEGSLFFMTLYFQGEPFLHKKFTDFCALAYQHKIYTITSSNGHYFTDETAEKTVASGLSRLIISIDGVDQESYAHYRVGGSLQKVLEGTKALINAKKRLKKTTPHIVWQFIVFKHNAHQVPLFKSMAKTYQVDSIQIKTAQVYDFETALDWIPEKEKLSRYKWKEGKFVFDNKLFNQCWKMWHSAVITWDGSVVPCCFDKDAKYAMGNLDANSFKEIWNAKPYQEFREKLFTGRNQIDICKNCSEGTKVWL
jgi:radical SAM protein with 4Fe4S-binding SPASM domain